MFHVRSMRVLAPAVMGLLALPMTASAQFNVSVVMSGLDNPRGLAMDHFGNVYVAEAGRGGNGTVFQTGEGSVQYGASGAVSRLFNGVQQRIITGLPSLAAQTGQNPGGSATGLHDIVFDNSGDLFGVFGLGADPAARASLGSEGTLFGTLSRLPIGGAPVMTADLAAYEGANNPDGGPADTNPYGIAWNGSGFATVDAGGNSLLNVSTSGSIGTTAIFPAQPNPLPFGPPVYDAVPTTVEFGPDGNYYVGQLTGFPFPQGGANVYRVEPNGTRTVAYSGFTNIIDLDFGADGNLYVLQLTTNGLAGQSGPGPGQLIKVDTTTGDRTVLLSDPLMFPGGLIAADDGSYYISNLGVAAGAGHVLHVTPVPEPATLGLMGIGLAGLIAKRRKRNA